MKILIQNAQVVLPERIVSNSYMVVENGTFKQISEKEILPNGFDETVDAKGDYIFPGLVDLQVNGGGGLTFNDCRNADDIEKILQANLATGTTSLLGTVMLSNADSMRQAIRLIAQAQVDSGAEIVGIHVEGPFFNSALTGMHDKANAVMPTVRGAAELIEAGAGKVKIMTLAPELLNGSEIIHYLKNEKVIASLGHSNATDEETKQALHAGATMATHLFNRMSTIHHHPGKAGMIPVLLNSKANLGLIADRAHVNDDLLRLLIKIQGANLFLVSDGLAPLGVNVTDFIYYGEKIIVRNGACFNTEGKMAGSATPLFKGVINMHQLGCDLPRAVAMASIIPAKIIGVDGTHGSIETGKKADFLIVDKDKMMLKSVYQGGKKSDRVYNI